MMDQFVVMVDEYVVIHLKIKTLQSDVRLAELDRDKYNQISMIK